MLTFYFQTAGNKELIATNFKSVFGITFQLVTHAAAMCENVPPLPRNHTQAKTEKCLLDVG